jgi:hypothetical protein
MGLLPVKPPAVPWGRVTRNLNRFQAPGLSESVGEAAYSCSGTVVLSLAGCDSRSLRRRDDACWSGVLTWDGRSFPGSSRADSDRTVGWRGGLSLPDSTMVRLLACRLLAAAVSAARRFASTRRPRLLVRD